MPDLKDSVGDGGVNQVHDVALVQAMLRLVKDAKGAAYLPGNYDGTYGATTKTAIAQFQTDHKLIPAKAATEKLGQMVAKGPSNQKLTALLPAAYRELHILANSKTVYLPALDADAKTSRTAINAYAEFEPMFRGKVVSLVRDMFDTHKIALWVTPTGWRRTFAQQAAETQTKAGPGESNHNFGRAVDLGFKGYKWLQGDGTVKQDSHWLNALETAKAAEATALWDARDALATKLGLFRLLFERVHLQAFDNNAVSSQRSLVKLLNSVGVMRWKAAYQCDLGTAGKHWVNVGSAKQVWAMNGPLTKADLAKALTAATGKLVKEADVKAPQVVAMKQALKADFEAADKNWLSWAAVL